MVFRLYFFSIIDLSKSLVATVIDPGLKRLFILFNPLFVYLVRNVLVIHEDQVSYEQRLADHVDVVAECLLFISVFAVHELGNW